MNCPRCNQEMKTGFLFTTKDGGFSFANEVPGVMKNAKHTDGFIEITPLKIGHRVHIKACCCEKCRLIQFEY